MNEIIFFNFTEDGYDNYSNSSSDSIVSDMPDSIYLPNQYSYGGEYFRAFNEWYRPIHGYLSIVLCCFGLLTNVLNIIVLTRKNMITPTNTILTGLAATDMCTMASYLLFAINFYFITTHGAPNSQTQTYHWTVVTLFHAHFSIICHTISIWLTVTLAVFRYIAVSVPSKNKRWCNMRRAKIAIVSAYLTTVIICIPNYLSITFTEDSTNSNKTIFYYLVESDIALANNRILLNANFWIFSVLTKLIPCVALTILSILLMRALYHANQRKRKLASRMGREEAERSCDRTTRMLLSVLLLFLITEFPVGMIALLSGILGPEFFSNVYQPLGDLMDILALINSGVNFVLYCTMSRQFRETFKLMFTPGVFNKWTQLQTSSRETETTTCV